uniref:Uncharacterized protein n=1 Tax=Eutreptiella gymnastica TaxID=73025 RepID=A0A6T2J4A8_9EUGL|mmetsp:Transcript_101527/g.171893  ORF Transcript_101527/g.171893 Transcript_101527/m.171893 type:complete len:152 (-) Transcript_101527:1628-2083(-)
MEIPSFDGRNVGASTERFGRYLVLAFDPKAEAVAKRLHDLDWNLNNLGPGAHAKNKYSGGMSLTEVDSNSPQPSSSKGSKGLESSLKTLENIVAELRASAGKPKPAAKPAPVSSEEGEYPHMAVTPTPANDHEDELLTVEEFQKLQNHMKK